MIIVKIKQKHKQKWKSKLTTTRKSLNEPILEIKNN